MKKPYSGIAEKVSGGVLAIAAAGLFISGAAVSVAAESTEAKVQCAGINSCKGKSECASAKNGCKSQNACKGQGWLMLSAKECKGKGGRVEKS